MAELKVVEQQRPGILKEIDEGAIDLVFQAIQEDIYSYPIKSFVREAISNGLDAIIERGIHKDIQHGHPVERFYRQQQDGKLLKDSEYDESYYSEKHLSSDDMVHVEYHVDSPRDNIRIKDFGVGLGGERLKGFFKLGYSSKRNMKNVIGKFGSGAKAGLATGVEYFIMNTTYNGYKTSFMIFKNDYEAITINTPTGKEEVWNVKMSDGTSHKKSIFWERTHKDNSVEIILEVKKHNKNAFIDAVKDQFQYFNGKVRLSTPDGVEFLDEKPLYESENLLIPKYSTYTTPHILVDGIAYGPISWDELELENRKGKLAIKVHATDVDITQSRESLKWTEKTKLVILHAIKRAEDEAQEYITSLLEVSNTENLFELNNTYGRMTGENAISSVFSKFLSMFNIRPKCNITSEHFPRTVKATLNDFLYEFLFYNFSVKRVKMNYNKDRVTTSTKTVESFEDMRGYKIVFAKDTSLGPRLAEHIMEYEYGVGSILYLRQRTDRQKYVLEFHGKDYNVKDIDAYIFDLLGKYADLNLDDYNPEYVIKEDDGELDGTEVGGSKISLAKQRRENKEVLYQYYSDVDIDRTDNYDSYSYIYRKATIKIKDLEEHFKGKKVVITTGNYKMLGKLVECTAFIFNELEDVHIIYVSQDNVKHFLPYGTLITDYFRTVNEQTGELMIGEHIRGLNTLRLFRELVDKHPNIAQKSNIISNFTSLDFKQIKTLSRDAIDYDPRTILEEDYDMKSKVLDDIFAYLEGLTEFQHVVKTGNAKKIATKAKELFNSDKIHNIDSYDEEFITSIRENLERLVSVEPILGLIPETQTISGEAVNLIEDLITLKTQNNDNIQKS